MEPEEKLIRHAVSVVIDNGKGKTLFALRSTEASSFPSTWSLPSHFVEREEKFEDTIGRIGKHKLGVKLELGELLNEGKSDRGDFILFMHDFEAKVLEGEPHLNSEHYTELKWEEPTKQINSMRVMGDCCRLYKEYLESRS